MVAGLPRIVRERLRAEFGSGGFDLLGHDLEGGVGVYRCTAWRLVPYGAGELADVQVPVPVPVVVRATRTKVCAVAVQEASASAIRDARAYARDLFARGAVAGVPAAPMRSPARPGPPGKQPVRPTHALERRSDGSRVLRRLGVAAR
jgi:hypothetical protein